MQIKLYEYTVLDPNKFLCLLINLEVQFCNIFSILLVTTMNVVFEVQNLGESEDKTRILAFYISF
jgi:hypothetical protein